MALECPICASGKGREVQRLQRHTMRLCEGCGVVYSDPMQEEADFYESCQDYALRDSLIVDPMRWEPRWDIEEFLKGGPHKGGNLLDVGCGTGFFLQRARQLGYEVCGIDFSQRAIARGREYFGIEALYATDLKGLSAQRPGLRFSTVTLFQVLEHLGDPNAVMADLKPLMEPGARLVLSMPYRLRWPDIIGEMDHPPHHLTRWERKSLEGFLKRHGFEIAKFTVEPFPPQTLVGPIYGMVKRFMPSLTTARHADATGAVQVSAEQAEALLASRKRKIDMARTMGLPLWALLKVLGARGPHMYVEAARTGG